MKLLIALIFLATTAMAQQPCNCKVEFENLVKKVESTYPGYRHKITLATRADYDHFVDSLSMLASGETMYDCYAVLKAFTSYFKDGHLLVYEFPNPSAEEKISLAKKTATYNISEKFATNYLAQKKKLDKAEGIWQNEDYRIAVLQSATPGTFTGTVLSSNNRDWKPGQLKLLLKKQGNKYEADYYRGDHAVIRMDASVSKNVLLNIGSFGWVKTYPVSKELQYHVAANPSMPVYTSLSKKTGLLTLPNFQIPQQLLDSLLLANFKMLCTKPNLIIDVRGNIGGNFIYYNLLALLNTGAMISDKTKILASEENIQYVSALISYAKENGLAADSTLIKLKLKMDNNKGGEIDYLDFPPVTFDSVFTAIKKVFIITDRANISAVEAFLQYAKQSIKVTQVGEATGGTIDYQQVRAIPLGCQGSAYHLYYPLYYRADLPGKAINKTGIVPAIKMDVLDINILEKIKTIMESN